MIDRKNTISFVFRFLLLPCFVAPKLSDVYEYGPDEYKSQIERLDGNLIMFYTPWCHPCAEFRPVWKELAEMVNTEDSKFAVAQIDCTIHHTLCQERDVTGYPTILYFHKNSFEPVEYRGTRDLPSFTLFMSEVFNMKSEGVSVNSSPDEVTIYSGMAYLTDQSFEKYVSSGQHFILFYAPWCRASQRLATTWAELGVDYAHNATVHIGKINCMEHETTCLNFDVKEYPRLLWIVNGKAMGGTTVEATMQELKEFVDSMVHPENQDPDKYLKKKKTMHVARISEDTFDLFMKKGLVYINFYAPWCGHCMQMLQTWQQLGDKYQNDSRIIIADVDCSQSENLCMQEEISQFPSLVLYKNNTVIHRRKGSTPLEKLSNLVEKYLRMITKEASKDEL